MGSKLVSKKGCNYTMIKNTDKVQRLSFKFNPGRPQLNNSLDINIFSLDCFLLLFLLSISCNSSMAKGKGKVPPGCLLAEPVT